jgi:hypothetical protein
MSCEVTLQDLTGEIKQSLLNIQRARPIDGSSVFVPITQEGKYDFRATIKDAVDKQTEKFHPTTYGQQVTIEHSEFGATLSINPSRQLAKDMTDQNMRDELGDDFFMGDEALGFQERGEDTLNLEGNAFSRFEARNEKKPITDNFAEYINYKKAQLDKVIIALSKLHRDRRNPKKNSTEITAKIKSFNLIKAKIQNDLEHLNTNEVDLMFSALIEEIQDINNTLDTVTSIEDVRDKLDFVYSFIKGYNLEGVETDIQSLKNFKHPDFAHISLAVDDLKDKYEDTLSKIRQQILESDISFKNNVLDKKDEQGNDVYSSEDLTAMFESTGDIEILEKLFLGINTSSSNDGVLPQVLKSYLETKTTLRKAEVKRYQDRLSKAISNIVDKKFDFIFEKTKDGVNTGNIISLFSPLFQTKLRDYFSIDNNEESEDGDKYRNKVEWLKKNTEVIDFRKLKAVQELYGDLYSEHFTFDDAQMDSYETELKKTLGPLYEEELSKVLNNLEIFQEDKVNQLEDDTNDFRYKNIARIDPWAFIANFNSPHSKEAIPYTNGGNAVYQVFSNIDNVRFIPKKEVYVTFDSASGEEVYQDSGYYNQDFNEVLNDSSKLEYWKVMKEVYSEYINPTYSNKKINEMSYAKFEKDWLESLSASKTLSKTSTLYKASKRGLKSLFYEVGSDKASKSIIQNYSDSSDFQIKEFKEILMQKSESELQAIAKQEGILPVPNQTKQDLASSIARQKIMKQYSMDINKVTAALLDKTAEHKSKEDTLPVANIILDSHKRIKTLKGKDRKNSVDRLESWIDRVIENESERYRGRFSSWLGKDFSGNNTSLDKMLGSLSKMPVIRTFVNSRKLSLLTETEKDMMKHLESLRETGHNVGEAQNFNIDGEKYILQPNTVGSLVYMKVIDNPVPDAKNPKLIVDISESEFDAAFKKNVEKKISNLGLDLNVAGLIQGIVKTIIIKALVLNPISGIFNRIEGKNSGLIMDMTGKFWKKGNMLKANSFLAFANFIKFLPERMKPDKIKKIYELKKLQVFINNVDLIQDRKNELERQAQKQDKPGFNYASKINLYQFAIDNPEFKNQGSILLSILMDTTITNQITGEQTPIFDGNGFPVYDLVDDILVLKDEYRSAENLSNWENFEIDEIDITNNQFFLTRSKIKNAISRSQGNYDNLDVIDATKNIWGRSLTLFMRWMPEHAMQRFSSGGDVDIVTGKTKLKGRYRSAMDNNPALVTTGVITLITSFGLTPVAGVLGIGLTGFIAYKFIKNLYSTNNIRAEVDSTQEFIDFAKAIVISTLNYPLNLVNVQTKNIPLIGKKLSTINSYNKSNLSPEEIGNLQAVAKELGMKLTMIALMLLGKSLTWDDDDEAKSEKRQLHDFIDNQMTRFIGALDVWLKPNAFINDVQRFAFIKFLGDLSLLLANVSTLNEEEKFKERFLKVTPIPRIITNAKLPYLDEREYAASQWQDVVIKDAKTDGEYSRKKKYTKLRAKIEEDIIAEVKKNGLTGDKAENSIKIKKGIKLPKRDAGESYKSAIKKLKRLNKIKD